jgi:hypothetical protein
VSIDPELAQEMGGGGTPWGAHLLAPHDARVIPAFARAHSHPDPHAQDVRLHT